MSLRIATAAVVVSIASLLVAASCQRAPAPGPLAPTASAWSMSGVPARVGQVIDFGDVQLAVHRPGLSWTLVAAAPVGMPKGMVLVGVGAVPGGENGTGYGFPPAHMRGLPLRVRGAAGVAIAVKATRNGVLQFRGVRVTYSVGSKQFVFVFPAGLRLCIEVACP